MAKAKEGAVTAYEAKKKDTYLTDDNAKKMAETIMEKKEFKIIFQRLHTNIFDETRKHETYSSKDCEYIKEFTSDIFECKGLKKKGLFKFPKFNKKDEKKDNIKPTIHFNTDYPGCYTIKLKNNKNNISKFFENVKEQLSKLEKEQEDKKNKKNEADEKDNDDNDNKNFVHKALNKAKKIYYKNKQKEQSFNEEFIEENLEEEGVEGVKKQDEYVIVDEKNNDLTKQIEGKPSDSKNKKDNKKQKINNSPKLEQIEGKPLDDDKNKNNNNIIGPQG